MQAIAIQDAIPHNYCWGCGTLNPRGLRLKSYVEGEGTICRFQPPPDFMAGPTHVLYGGIIAAVIDCHCCCTAIAHGYREAGRALGSEPLIWSVTARLQIDYLAPTPIARPVELRARIVEAKGRKRVVACSVRSDGKETVRAELVAVDVPASWRDPPAGE